MVNFYIYLKRKEYTVTGGEIYLTEKVELSVDNPKLECLIKSGYQIDQTYISTWPDSI